MPEGPFAFLDYIRDKDGDIIGMRQDDFVQFDPGVLVEEDGAVWLYTGNGYSFRVDFLLHGIFLTFV